MKKYISLKDVYKTLKLDLIYEELYIIEGINETNKKKIYNQETVSIRLNDINDNKLSTKSKKSEKQQMLELFLDLIGKDLKTKSNELNLISKLNFYEYFNIPLIFSERIYYLLFNFSDKITLETFKLKMLYFLE